MQSAAQIVLVLAILAQSGYTDEEIPKRTAREALKPFNGLIGSWRALGTPEGKLQDKQKGLWEETIRWEWQFKDKDAWLKVTFEKGKHFVDGTLRYLPKEDLYELSLTNTDQRIVTFAGHLQEQRLIVERLDERKQETQRLVLSMLFDNRYVYHYEVQGANSSLIRKLYVVGASRQGVPFVKTSDEIGPFCVISYGPPLTPVSYKGKTYYVC